MVEAFPSVAIPCALSVKYPGLRSRRRPPLSASVRRKNVSRWKYQ